MDTEVSFNLEDRERFRILIVEDHRELAETLALFFEYSGFVATIEANPLAALKLPELDKFDAFLIDVGLDSISGIELARRLRKIPELKSAVLIAVTGLGGIHHHSCMSAGFDAFFTKPTDMAHVVKILLDKLNP